MKPQGVSNHNQPIPGFLLHYCGVIATKEESKVCGLDLGVYPRIVPNDEVDRMQYHISAPANAGADGSLRHVIPLCAGHHSVDAATATR